MKKTIAILMTVAGIFMTCSVSTFAEEKTTAPKLIMCATETEDYTDYETIEEYYDGEITTPDEYMEPEIEKTTQSVKKETNVPKTGNKRKSYSMFAALVFALTILAYCIVRDKKSKKDKNNKGK